MDLFLVQVAYMAGDGTHPAAEGPARLVDATAEALTVVGVRTEVVDVGLGSRDPVTGSARVNARLAAVVRGAVGSGELPVVLAGSCDAALGVLGGLPATGVGRRGVVWVDAHADFNTPESSVSGFLPGMTLATVAGHGHADLRDAAGLRTPVPEDAIALIGVRSLAPAEEASRLRRSALTVVGWTDGRAAGDVAAALDLLAARVDSVYLHVDNDAFDPSIAPGVVDEPVPGGLSEADMAAVLDAVLARFRVEAVTVATFTPGNDVHDRTLRADVRLIQRVGRYAAAKQG